MAKRKSKDVPLNEEDVMHASPLGDKHTRFVEEYLISGNATKAAMAAGYPKASARSSGYYLLTNIDIRATLEAAKREQAKRFKATTARVVKEIARLAFTGQHDYTRTANLKMLGDHLGIFDGKGKSDPGPSDDVFSGILGAAEKAEDAE